MEASFLWNIIFFKSLQEMKTLHNNEGQEIIVTMLSRDVVGGGGRDILSSCRGGGSIKRLVKLQISTETWQHLYFLDVIGHP